MADQTSIQESAQALFCAMADFVGAGDIDKAFDAKKYPTYSEFKTFWNNTAKYKAAAINNTFVQQVVAPGVTLRDIEELFKTDRMWYLSSLNIAKKLIKEVDTISTKFSRIKSPRWSDLLYVRGDKEIMKNIEELFKIANNTQKKINSLPGKKAQIILGDVNKWSPADIYFASTKAKDRVSKTLTEYKGKQMTFTVLNSLISDLIDSGDLLPLSLKKQPNDVRIEKVNFDRKEEIKKVGKYEFIGFSDWSPYKKGKPATRDLKIFFDPASPKTYIKVRHDASSQVMKIEVEVSGGLARGGSIGSAAIFANMISTLDSTFGQKFISSYTKANDNFKKEVNTKEMEILKTRNKVKYDELRGEKSAMLVTNIVHPMLMDWLKRDKKRADAFIRMVYMYITSRTDISGRFVIAK